METGQKKDCWFDRNNDGVTVYTVHNDLSLIGVDNPEEMTSKENHGKKTW